MTGLYKGDIRELIKKVPNESIDCIVSDIPYRIIAGGVRIVPQDDEMGGVLKQEDKGDLQKPKNAKRCRILV